MFITQLKTNDGAIFNVKFIDDIPNASGLKYNGRYFFFRTFKDGKAIFEEGNVVFIFEDEIQKDKKEIYP